MSKQKNLSDVDHQIIIDAYNGLPNKDDLSKNKIKKILSEQLGYSQSTIYRVITAKQIKSGNENVIAQLLQQINDYTNSNIALQLNKMNLQQLIEKYESINPIDIRYKDLLEKLITITHEADTKIAVINTQAKADEKKLEVEREKLQLQREQMEAQKGNKKVSTENAALRVKAAETVKSKVQTQVAALEAKTSAAEVQNIKKSVIKVETKIKGRFSQSRQDAQNAEICSKYKGVPELQSEYDIALESLKQSFEASLEKSRVRGPELDSDELWRNQVSSSFNFIKKQTRLESALFYLNQVALPANTKYADKSVKSLGEALALT